MTVGTFVQPDFESDSGTEYKIHIDNSIAAMARIGGAFAPHEQDTPDMTVRVDAGPVWRSGVLTEKAAQDSATITAPITHPRIDRVVKDVLTAVISVVPGDEAASPAAPDIPDGKEANCQVLLQTTTTAIDNNMITDERVLGGGGNLAFPVGAVYLSITGVNPATELGYGIWSAIASGKMLVGYDSGDTDFNAAEKTGGAKTTSIPSHTHSTPSHSHSITTVLSTNSGPLMDFDSPIIATNTSGSGTSSSGGSITQDVLNPYFVVYIWKRTA
jgi:hypothetical protein